MVVPISVIAVRREMANSPARSKVAATSWSDAAATKLGVQLRNDTRFIKSSAGRVGIWFKGKNGRIRLKRPSFSVNNYSTVSLNLTAS